MYKYWGMGQNKKCNSEIKSPVASSTIIST